jgi:hypothetical protein
MDEARASKVTEVLKNLGNVGKNVQKSFKLSIPKAPEIPEMPNAIGIPVKKSWFLRVLMYFIAGLLLIGILLLAVDQWITPIFQRSPGGTGYIPIPGTDSSQVFWQSPAEVRNIIIGNTLPPVVVKGVPPQASPPSCTILEGQNSYSITMDVLINNEYPQKLGDGQNQRVFFVMSQTVDNPSLRVSLDNEKNRVYITCFDRNGLQQSISLDNVPIHTPFRVGLTISNYIIEGYLNGLLVKTRQLDSPPIPPTTGDKIFAPANIIINDKVLSRGISVLNIRAFGTVISSGEMKWRMNDLLKLTDYNF